MIIDCIVTNGFFFVSDHLDDAYEHCVAVNKRKAFHENLPWFMLTVGVLEVLNCLNFILYKQTCIHILLTLISALCFDINQACSQCFYLIF